MKVLDGEGNDPQNKVGYESLKTIVLAFDKGLKGTILWRLRMVYVPRKGTSLPSSPGTDHRCHKSSHTVLTLL